MRVDHLVVDSSAFIQHGPIKETGGNIYTCQEVLDEIKDKATLDSLRFLPYELKLLQFDQDDLEHCIEFAKKTGDYRQLSAVDLRLIAATYRLGKLHNDTKYPEQEEVSEMDLDRMLDEEAALGGSEDDDDDDDGEGWITPSNIDKVRKKMDKSNRTIPDALVNNRIPVACMTSDFSIQNCLLQMGLGVVSPVDGMMIKEAKKIALRCHACFKVFHEPSKIKNNFCPHCGNLDTLKRVQYKIEKDGTKKVIVNFKRPIRVKGTNQQLPAPRGGKHANTPLLAPDQRVRKDKMEKFIVQEQKTVTPEHILHDPAYLVRTNPFAYRNNQTRQR